MVQKIPLAELLRADLRVGERYQARTALARHRAWMRWVLDFAWKDLTSLSQGDRLRIREEVGALGVTCLHDQAEDADEIEEWLKALGKSQQTFGVIPSHAEVETIQTRVRSVLERVLSVGQASLGPFTVTVYVSRLDKTQRPPIRRAIRHEDHGGGIVEGILYQFSWLLGQHAAMVERCPEPRCGRFFLADRTNQRYHSTRCQSRATSREYRSLQRQATRRPKTRKKVRP